MQGVHTPNFENLRIFRQNWVATSSKLGNFLRVLLQLLRERLGSIYCICRNQRQNSVFQPSQSFCFENIFFKPKYGGPSSNLESREGIAH